GKSRVVYSSGLDTSYNILYDLYKVWNYPHYKLEPIEGTASPRLGISLLVDSDGEALAKHDGTDLKFYTKEAYYSFYEQEDWEHFICSRVSEGCKVIEY
ncbi:MAG: hypothetical protein ACRC6E_14840, partial [Fusobacteriaceae bacterium]